MQLRLANSHGFENKYYWACFSFPLCPNIQTTILSNRSFEEWHTPRCNANTLKYLRPNDIVSDAKRHFAINEIYSDSYKFVNSDFKNLDLLLGFENQNDFFFWIASQQSVVTHSIHNYLPVGSPYYYTFKNLTDSINSYFKNILSFIIREQQLLIEKSLVEWEIYISENRNTINERKRIIEERINNDYKIAQKRKSEKATINIFNAIRRKDIKAIIALINKGANFNYINSEGLNCITYAKILNDKNVIETLCVYCQNNLG